MIRTDDRRDPLLIQGKDLERHFILEEAMLEFARLFGDEANDRAMVIVGVSFLDTQLQHILFSFLVDDEKEVSELLHFERPLGTYSNRARIAYCLGLIGPVIHHDLRLIGKIRNRFAHNLHASFSNSEIISWVSELKWHRIAYMEPPASASARDLFNVGLNQVAAHLSGLVSVARLDRRSIRREA